MADVMTFPERIEDFLKYYSFRDEDEVYTNGSELIGLYRVKQALDHYYTPVIHAHWIEDEHVDDLDYCSNCREAVGRYVTAGQMDRQLYKGASFWGYCPHCGAKMDEVTE